MTLPDRPKYFFALLLWSVAVIVIVNPKTIHLLFGGDQQIISPEIDWAILLFDLYILLLPPLWRLFRGRPKARNLIINQVVLICSVLLVLTVVEAADIALGKLRRNWDLVFLPNSSAHYKTPEFDYTVEINRFGFRGPKDLSDLGGDSYDVLMIGDSFTFGWGLTDGETWPRGVEQRLRAAGVRARIFNLGRPGSSPIGYVEIARCAAPILKPDLIVVNILQGDDLFQLTPKQTTAAVRTRPEGAGGGSLQRLRGYFKRFPSDLYDLLRRLRENFRRFLPNLYGLLGGGIFGNQDVEASIVSNWIKQAETSLRILTPEQRRRFDVLDDTIKVMFAKGWLNPFMVVDGILSSGRFLCYEDLNSPATQTAIRALGGKLRDIGEIARKCRCEVLVCLVPNGPYVSSNCHSVWRSMGYLLDDRLLTSSSSEAAIHEAAQMAGLDFYSPLSEFREAAKEKQLYYEFDGHFNPAGADLYAQYMIELLVARMAHAQSAARTTRRP